MCSPRRTFLRTGYADSDRSVREDYCRPAVAQLSLPALGPRARDVRASGPLDLLPLGEDVVPVSFADVTSGNTTRGHRVLGPGDHVVASPAVYEQVLEDAGVLSAERRREAILAGIAEVEAARPGCHVDTPKKVFEEVINLCEWPTVLVGTFDEEFLKVPHEIICESMLTNQRYFPIYDGEGRLTREFVVVSNSKPENAERAIDGNERVVRARLTTQSSSTRRT